MGGSIPSLAHLHSLATCSASESGARPSHMVSCISGLNSSALYLGASLRAKLYHIRLPILFVDKLSIRRAIFSPMTSLPIKSTNCHGLRPAVTTSLFAFISLPSVRRIPVAVPFSIVTFSTSAWVKNLQPSCTRIWWAAWAIWWVPPRA